MNNIIISNEISSGSPTIRGRRLTVFNVVSKIYYEDTLTSALEDYEISVDIAKEAVHYCSNLQCQNDVNLISFCSGCILRTIQEGWTFKKENYEVIVSESRDDEISIMRNGDQIFLGSTKELEDSEFGTVGWLIAATIKNKYPILAIDNEVK